MRHTCIFALIAVLCLGGCGEDDSTSDSSGMNASDDPAAAASMDQQTGDAGESGDTGPEENPGTMMPNEELTPCVADAPGELCVWVTVPDDVPSLPEKVSVHFFTSLPPMGPPSILGAEIAEASELAQFEPGARVPLVMAGLPASGEMYLYGVLYMPGGGAQTWQTVPDVDYHGAYSWDEPIQFTGEPIVLETPISFSLYTE